MDFPLRSFFFGEANITLNALLLAGGLFLGIFFLVSLIKFFSGLIYRKMKKLHTVAKDFFSLVHNVSRYSCSVFSLFFASLSLPFVQWIRVVFALLFVVGVVVEIGALAKFLLHIIMDKALSGQDKKTKTNLTQIINTIMQVIIWVLAVLIVFDTIGIKITPLLASLGVGGIAVAFAAQKLLEDFFASFSIMGSMPFRIGDIITVSGFTGTVQQIGLRTTTLLTVEGKNIVIPNRIIVANVVENSGMIKERRKRFSLTVTYETPVAKLRKIPHLVGTVIKKYPEANFERAMLRDLKDSCLEVVVSYSFADNDWLLSIQVHEKILLDILELFEKEGIEFAYPTQTLFLKK